MIMRRGSVDIPAIVVFFFVVLFSFLFYVEGLERGEVQGRCAERWRYQRTVQDTLATVRSGCVLPGAKR